MKKYKYQLREERRLKIEAHKQRLIDAIIEDLRANLYDSESYIWSLCRDALSRRTIKDLKEINA